MIQLLSFPFSQRIASSFCKGIDANFLSTYPCHSSVQVFGLITQPLVRLLLPAPKASLNRMISSEPTTPKSFIVPLLGNGQDSEADLPQHVPRPSSLRMLLSTPSHTVHYYWRKFDNAFMRPVFGGRGFVPYVPGSPTEQSVHHLIDEETES